MRALLLAALLAVSSATIAQDAPKKEINLRAFSCEPIEFAELNSVGFAELESMYCSAHEGSSREFDRAKAVPDWDNNRVITATRMALAFSERCKRIYMPASDIARRKFAGQKFDCAPYKAAVASALNKAPAGAAGQ